MPLPVHYLKSAIPVAQKGCAGTPSQQLHPELLRASAQDTELMAIFMPGWNLPYGQVKKQIKRLKSTLRGTSQYDLCIEVLHRVIIFEQTDKKR